MFRRAGADGQSIFGVPLIRDVDRITDSTEEIVLSEHPALLSALAQEALFNLFVKLGRPVVRRYPLQLLSQKPGNLISESWSLPSWLQKRVAWDLETRRVRSQGGKPLIVLLADMRTKNIIDCTLGELGESRIPIIGRYVGVKTEIKDERVWPRLKLLGKIRELNGEEALLSDYGMGSGSVKLCDAHLEPRRENFDWCIKHLAPTKYESIISALAEQTSAIASGPKRLEQIKKTFDYVRKQPIEIVPGINLEVGELIGGENQKIPLRSEIIKKPVLVFDPSGVKTDTWNERGIDKHGPYDQRTFAPKQLRIAVICNQADEGRVEAFMAKFLDGLPSISVRDRKPYEKGFIRRFALSAPKVHFFTTKGASSEDYVSACREALKFAGDQNFEWSLAIAQIDEEFHDLPESSNPYFAIKAAFLKHRVPIQEITLETISKSDRQLVYIMNNVSLATYAKIGGTPWLLRSAPTVGHELVIGLGSQIISTSRLSDKERVVGITTIFSSDGRYLLDDRTGAVPYEQYEAALAETLSRAIERVRAEDNWRSTDSVRLIFHVFQQIKDREAEAVGKLIEKLGFSDVKFAFVHVVDNHPFSLFDEHNQGVRFGQETKGVMAPERGLSISLSDDERLVCFTGSHEVKQASHGLPRPTLLRLHRNSTFRDMTYISRQAYDFSNHSWRMLSPAPMPITIHYAELIARLLSGLQNTPGWDPDIMLGPVGRSRWFL
ncbi:argonaute/piwi family protein [Methylobacterium sp. C33D]